MIHKDAHSGGSAAVLPAGGNVALHTARAVMAPVGTARPITPQSRLQELEYASFGARLLAMIIDMVILNTASSMIQAPFLMLMLGNLNPTTMIVSFAAPILLFGGLATFYTVWLESSAWQATLGKKILGLHVVDLDGQRITFWKSASRNFNKSISSLILGIGYLMPLWTAKRQALHDRMARCLVIKKRSARR
ncbi:MAG: RDD family protein [Planctomycetes bacterium]|nr:RDD family protein [Planctomycetota bacterium]